MFMEQSSTGLVAVGGVKSSEASPKVQQESPEEKQNSVVATVPGSEHSGEQRLTIGVRDNLEAVEKKGIVGRFFDRVKMLRDRLETADINTAVTRADARHNQTSIKAEAARIEVEEAERLLTEKEAMLRVLGSGTSEKALAQLRAELQAKKDRHAELVSKLGEKKEKLDGLRKLQGNHEMKANEIIGQVNTPVNAKIAANLAESTLLQASEKAMVDRLTTLQKELDELQKLNEEMAIKWRAQKRGRVKDDLEQAGRLAMAKAQLKADQILRLERKLDKTRGRIWDLKDINTALERKRVPLLGVSRPDESLDPITGKKKKKVIEKRPARLRPQIRRPIGME